jgi:hypothetical protein
VKCVEGRRFVAGAEATARKMLEQGLACLVEIYQGAVSGHE